jgi:hypothetical protein
VSGRPRCVDGGRRSGPETDRVDDWSPNGRWLVTQSDRHPPHGSGFQLYLMRPDGTGQRRLTEGGGENINQRSRERQPADRDHRRPRARTAGCWICPVAVGSAPPTGAELGSSPRTMTALRYLSGTTMARMSQSPCVNGRDSLPGRPTSDRQFPWRSWLR